MAWLIVDPNLFDGSGSSPWHITAVQSINVPTRREMAVHGELLIEGQLIVHGTGRVRVLE